MNISKAWWFIRTKITGHMYGRVGKHSYIGKPMFIQRPRNVFIGNNVRIYPGMRLELTEENARLVIQDNVSIGQGFHAVSYEGDLVIGENTTISGNVFISNVDHDYKEIGVHSLDQQMLYSDTLIDSNCFIGYGAVILPGTKLGKQCIVGANAVVKGAYPDYCVITGNPGKIVKKYNVLSKKWEKMN